MFTSDFILTIFSYKLIVRESIKMRWTLMFNVNQYARFVAKTNKTFHYLWISNLKVVITEYARHVHFRELTKVKSVPNTFNVLFAINDDIVLKIFRLNIKIKKFKDINNFKQSFYNIKF